MVALRALTPSAPPWPRDCRPPKSRQGPVLFPGGDRRGEGAQGDHEHTLPLVGSVSGKVRLYVERGRGGGADRDEHQDHRGESRASKILLVWVLTSLTVVWRQRIEGLNIIGWARLLRPFTHTRAKYHQPHISGGQTLKHWDDGQDTGGSMAPAASQSYGWTVGDNRRYWWGRQINDKRTERRQEEDRDARAGKMSGDMDLGRGNL